MMMPDVPMSARKALPPMYDEIDLRRIALEMAIGSGNMHSTPAMILRTAAQYYAFLTNQADQGAPNE